jgi:hypothetical protein
VLPSDTRRIGHHLFFQASVNEGDTEEQTDSKNDILSSDPPTWEALQVELGSCLGKDKPKPVLTFFR